MALRICIAGATGWAGSSLSKAIFNTSDLTIHGAVSRKHAGGLLGNVIDVPGLNVEIKGTVEEALETETDIFFDYTLPDVVKRNVLIAIERGIPVVIGTSGLMESDFVEIDQAALRKNVGVIAAGNFAITTVLLERFAIEAARHLSSWEVLDYASAQKPDAPSGFSRELAFRMSQVKSPEEHYPIEKTIGKKESRGATFYESQIHSIRLPGYVISLEIIFGEAHERLILRHDAGTGAEPYLAGALLAIRKVRQYKGLIRGLERIMDWNIQ